MENYEESLHYIMRHYKVDMTLEEKKLEKDLKLIERIEKEENTKSENDEN